MNPVTPTQDLLGRPLRDLRVSVTDRCNFRCRYCMPRETFGPGFRFLPRAEILAFEEITRVVEAASSSKAYASDIRRGKWTPTT